MYRHLAQLKSEHEGANLVRRAIDSFTTKGSNGQEHQVIVHEPLSIKITQLQRLMPNYQFPAPVLRAFSYKMLLALDFLHSEAGVIHCGELFILWHFLNGLVDGLRC
jgi:serine/threonine-protein kinase SRPK3